MLPVSFFAVGYSRFVLLKSVAYYRHHHLFAGASSPLTDGSKDDAAWKKLGELNWEVSLDKSTKHSHLRCMYPTKTVAVRCVLRAQNA